MQVFLAGTTVGLFNRSEGLGEKEACMADHAVTFVRRLPRQYERRHGLLMDAGQVQCLQANLQGIISESACRCLLRLLMEVVSQSRLESLLKGVSFIWMEKLALEASALDRRKLVPTGRSSQGVNTPWSHVG